MATIKVTGTDMSYHLVGFDKNGNERTSETAGIASHAVLEEMRTQPVTDVFIFVHGWKGDIPRAREQYQAWIGSMAACKDDIAKFKERCPGFRPLFIGLHWPSLPWGVEDDQDRPVAFETVLSEGLDGLVADAASKLVDTPAAREALRTLFEAALADADPNTLPAQVIQAYRVLDRECMLGNSDLAGSPSDDRAPFDPVAAFANASGNAGGLDFGGGGFLGSLLSPLVQLSFWKMKDRARLTGETGGFNLIAALQKAAGPQVRFHLMGHSFGCIVVSAALMGPAGTRLPRPVDSVFLVQGALSLWSFCSDIDRLKGRPGYFHRLVSDTMIHGPLVTTRTEHDHAVGKIYPLAAGAANQVAFDAPNELPTFGAIGTFGARGPGFPSQDLDMLAAAEEYTFHEGVLYNLDASRYICDGDGIGGAHSDIAKPEVAHAFWSAAMSTA